MTKDVSVSIKTKIENSQSMNADYVKSIWKCLIFQIGEIPSKHHNQVLQASFANDNGKNRV
jgi:hypothetical protein